MELPTKTLTDMNFDLPTEGLHTSDLEALELVYRGKVRDIYQIDEAHWLIIATDRVSAFDVIMPNTIPGKGILLTQLALYWFNKARPLIANHLANIPIESVLEKSTDRNQALGRSMIVTRLKPLPIEAVVRGYLIGSGWLDYQQTGQVCGVALPEGLRKADKLPEIIFTPATKAELGEHDENISFEQVVDKIGKSLAEDIQRVSKALYRTAAQHAESKGIIIADTKFEFGQDSAGNLVLMDEILTPDSSRFWEADSWAPGSSPASYDKQFVRDWLETQPWDKQPPGPTLPETVIQGTLNRYKEAYSRLAN